MATIDVNTLEILNGDLTAKVGDAVKRLFPKTTAENVSFTSSTGATDLATVITTLITEIEDTATTENVNALVTEAVNTAVAGLVEGAPEELDTLKELAALATSNSDLLATLNTAILNKVDKVSGESLVADGLIGILETITAEKIASWDKGQANVLETVTVNGVKQTPDGEKGIALSIPTITVASAVPDDFAVGSLCFVV